MAYYIISFETEPMKEFQGKLPFLEEATWIKAKKNLSTITTSPDEGAIFFIYLTENIKAFDDWVLLIRSSIPTAKIVYVTPAKLPEMKAHQSSAVGGDAYITTHIDPDSLSTILAGLMPQELNQYGNRLERTVGNAVKISDQHNLEEMLNHPKSLEIEKIFSSIFEKKTQPSYQSAATLIDMPLPAELSLGEAMRVKETKNTPKNNMEADVPTKTQETASIDEGGIELNLTNVLGPGLAADDTSEVSGNGTIDFTNPAFSLSTGDEEFEETNFSGSTSDEISIDETPTVNYRLNDNLNPRVETREDSSNDIEISIEDNSSIDLSLGGNTASFNKQEFNSSDIAIADDPSIVNLTLGENSKNHNISLNDDFSLGDDDHAQSAGEQTTGASLSDDALEKLKEIDAIMNKDESQPSISMPVNHDEKNNQDGLAFSQDNDLALNPIEVHEDSIETSLVSDDLNLDSINFSLDDEDIKVEVGPKEDKPKKKTKETLKEYSGDIGKELKEISGAYSGEMERMQATISNLRSDREDLLAKIQRLEDDKVLQNRQILTMRAELDEKKIELSIIRKKLNEEISELKDRLKLHEERKLILEEKNKILTGELDKAVQKNKIDVKKVQMRERELEQRLELLKTDSESQIRHRDLKILELKRKLDGMEFDMESISMQEKRSIESRFELEDKLDKAIKTLRSAITVLEDEADSKTVLESLKKNIDM